MISVAGTDPATTTLKNHPLFWHCMTETNKHGKKESDKGEQAITKEMPIGEIVMNHPETMDVFMKYGMHCIGCAAAHFENLEQGCAAHGIDADKMVADLNKAVKKVKKTEQKDE